MNYRIRQYEDKDLNEVVSAWDKASEIGHPFFEKAFQAQERKNLAELYLPNADTWVVEIDNQVIGFIALIENEVAGLFLDPEYHDKKIGKLMMDKAQALHGNLEVEVFKKNLIGRNFYDQYGFSLLEEKIHEQTGEQVLRLKFTARN